MQPIITTSRLKLRPFTALDAARVAELAGDSRIAAMTANIPHPYQQSDATLWIARHASLFSTGRGVVYAIVVSDSDELVGAVSLPVIDQGTGTLGYWLGVDYWGLGYATEAAKALVDFAKQHLGLLQLKVMHLKENQRSRAVVKKLGVTYIGEQMNRMQGQDREVCVYLSAV
ncbi:GNAT family N-acetyltransferase [Bacterioplanes sanyensis]|uniref:GNAT family N-acetyltransferase n=1 Tax=Bacterioplanes sanyensis TaxID=1249553 RepID=A0A222FI71_9GAMM|nr:GNAT family N-acetyltransferase [Bacterioplanes sanyensis]ASP38470.1 GNAT family N-acetyltransferase [Bacterioplanes sanyensis]